MFPTIFVTLSMIMNLVTGPVPTPVDNSKHLLAERSYSLEDRYPDKWVSGIFKDNILLTLAYLRGYQGTQNVDWTAVEKPFHYEFTLQPGQTFAFHDDALPQFKDSIVKTTGSHFNWSEGYKYDGWLVGDGVCHLASFINWVARDAGLEVVSPTRHDFAAIPDVPAKYGVSIYANPQTVGSNELQNLYIKDNKQIPVEMNFDFDGQNLKISVFQIDK